MRSLLGRVVADVNRGAAHAERVRGFAALPRELRAEEGELTPTLKARRRVCEEHFRDLIESLYADARPRPPSPDTGSAAGPGEAAPPDDPPALEAPPPRPASPGCFAPAPDDPVWGQPARRGGLAGVWNPTSPY